MWLFERCSALKVQNDAALCLQWLREFTEAGGFLPIEEQFLMSNSFGLLREGFKLCVALRSVIDIASKEVMSTWVTAQAQQFGINDLIFALLCRLKVTFCTIEQVCQTESGSVHNTTHLEVYCTDHLRFCILSRRCCLLFFCLRCVSWVLDSKL